MLHDLYRNILKFKGHDVIGEAYNGKECIDKLKYNGIDPDFILLDYRMPIKNGLETLVELLKVKSKFKVIFLSSDSNIRNKALSSGAIKFIQKPFSIHEFFEILSQLEK